MAALDDMFSQMTDGVGSVAIDIMTAILALLGIFLIIWGLKLLGRLLLGSLPSDDTTFESCDNSLRLFRKKERFMNSKYGRGHSREWDSGDDKYL